MKNWVRCPHDHHPQEWLYEAWERMTYGGVIARPCEIVPSSVYTEIGGVRVTYLVSQYAAH